MNLNANIMGDAKAPRWSLVVLMILALAVETFGEFVIDAVKREEHPPIEWGACDHFCYSQVKRVTAVECECQEWEVRYDD